MARRTLSRLDDALELAPADRLRWVEGLGSQYDAMRTRLRHMIGQAGSLEEAGFLQTIPKVDAPDRDGLESPGDEGAVPNTVGPYRVLRKLATGGMGTVWLAQRSDGMLNRLVALKLPSGAWPLAGLAERMAREREILATLEHPNIARLYDAGMTITGQPYLALEYVAGWPLDDHVKARSRPLRARLHLFLQVARAIRHAPRLVPGCADSRPLTDID
jgi:eukaryotic-like serine/threonine-protein kinase